jgi:hypothetical protein
VTIQRLGEVGAQHDYPGRALLNTILPAPIPWRIAAAVDTEYAAAHRLVATFEPVTVQVTTFCLEHNRRVRLDRKRDRLDYAMSPSLGMRPKSTGISRRLTEEGTQASGGGWMQCSSSARVLGGSTGDATAQALTTSTSFNPAIAVIDGKAGLTNLASSIGDQLPDGGFQPQDAGLPPGAAVLL